MLFWLVHINRNNRRWGNSGNRIYRNLHFHHVNLRELLKNKFLDLNNCLRNVRKSENFRNCLIQLQSDNQVVSIKLPTANSIAVVVPQHNHDIFLIKNDNAVKTYDKREAKWARRKVFFLLSLFPINKVHFRASISFFCHSSSLNDFSSLHEGLLIQFHYDATEVFLLINSATDATSSEAYLFLQRLILISLSILFMLCHGMLRFEISFIVFWSMWQWCLENR